MRPVAVRCLLPYFHAIERSLLALLAYGNHGLALPTEERQSNGARSGSGGNACMSRLVADGLRFARHLHRDRDRSHRRDGAFVLLVLRNRSAGDPFTPPQGRLAKLGIQSRLWLQ